MQDQFEAHYVHSCQFFFTALGERFHSHPHSTDEEVGTQRGKVILTPSLVLFLSYHM